MGYSKEKPHQGKAETEQATLELEETGSSHLLLRLVKRKWNFNGYYTGPIKANQNVIQKDHD